MVLFLPEGLRFGRGYIGVINGALAAQVCRLRAELLIPLLWLRMF